MSNHTPEPWKSQGSVFYGNDSHDIGYADGFSQTLEQDVINAARIVQCVNACAGMENPAEEIAKLKAENEQLSADFWKVHKERTNAEREVARIQKERDAYFDRLHELRADRQRLIEALEEAIPYLERSVEKHGRETADNYRKLLTEQK